MPDGQDTGGGHDASVSVNDVRHDGTTGDGQPGPLFKSMLALYQGYKQQLRNQ